MGARTYFENKRSVGKSKNGHSRPHPLVCLLVKEAKAQGEKVGPEQGHVATQLEGSNQKLGQPQAFKFSH